MQIFYNDFLVILSSHTFTVMRLFEFSGDCIRYYLGEEPIIEQVPTYICERKDDRLYTTENIDKLVVKAVNEAGGYGMLVGPRSTKGEREDFIRKVNANPRNYIAQPLVELLLRRQQRAGRWMYHPN